MALEPEERKKFAEHCSNMVESLTGIAVQLKQAGMPDQLVSRNVKLANAYATVESELRTDADRD
jgi:hypothetical protein